MRETISYKLLTVILLLGACVVQPEQDIVPIIVQIDVTATPRPSVTPTATPAPTYTPTATAPAVEVSDNLREIRSSAPSPQSGAPCGVVDFLDFPLDPPHGVAFSGGGDFGRYRSRYNGIHTGEDWWRRGGVSFGSPVYGIGHGTVTYAQPLGWGVDRGVVIVRHVFPDSSTILSFYGHLDPPSVTLRAGDCVTRGDMVGRIGRPSSPPHLHFEIRSHLPTTPGPGYWSVDPQLAGWRPPSQTIWNYRIDTSPGVQWTRPFTAATATGVGTMHDGTFVAIEERRLIGIDPLDGSLRWSQPMSVTLIDAAIDTNGRSIYVSTLRGSISAFDLPDPQGGNVPELSPPSLVPTWQVRFNAPLRARLMPLPGGGVAVHAERQMIGLSESGEELWELGPIAAPFDWVFANDELIFTTAEEGSRIHTVDKAGPLSWAARIGGRPIIVGDQVFVYDREGIYRLNRDTLTAELLYALPRAFPALGQSVALPDGGLLVAHLDLSDKRLIVLNADGTLRWERSISRIILGLPRLFVIDDNVYGVLRDGDVVSIDVASGEVRRIFDVGTRDPLRGETWAYASDADHILIDYRGGRLVAFDPQIALDAILNGSDSQ